MKCPSCGYENKEDAEYCNLCQASFVKANADLGGLAPLHGLRPEPSQEAVKAGPKVSRSQATGLNWFQRHLHWTWLLPQLFLIIVAMLVMSSFIASMGPAFILDPTARPSVLPSFSFSIFVIAYAFVLPLLGAASVWGIGAWVLKRKSRSLWWLLIFLIPTAAYWLNAFVGFAALVVVWIIFLRLENRSVLPALPEYSTSIQPGLAPQGLKSPPTKYGP